MKPPKARTEEGRRLAAFLAEAGVASRRKADQAVRGGLVRVNGAPVLDPAFKVFPGRDKVVCDGNLVSPASSRNYIILNKPRGYLTACSDAGGKRTIMELVPVRDARLYPVGRLDFNAEGLLLLTDDGPLAHRLTHPSYQVPRTYLVKVSGKPEPWALARITRGLRDGGEFLRAREVRPVRQTKANSWFEVVLTEGKNREVRRLFSAIGHPVARLIRTAFGSLSLGRLPTGESRRLTLPELQRLKRYLDRNNQEE